MTRYPGFIHICGPFPTLPYAESAESTSSESIRRKPGSWQFFNLPVVIFTSWLFVFNIRYRYQTFRVSMYRPIDRLCSRTPRLIRTFNFLYSDLSSWIPRLIRTFDFLCSDFIFIFFLNTIGSFSSCKLDLRREYRVSSIRHNSGTYGIETIIVSTRF